MNEELEINDLLYKTITSSDKNELTDEDINNIHKQLKNLKHLKEEQKKKDNKKELVKSIFAMLFHLIYMGIIFVNILIIPLLIVERDKFQSLGVGDLIILLVEITLTAIFTEYIYFKTTDKINTLKKDVEELKDE